MEQMLRVNLSTGSLRIEPVPAPYRLLGGRALTSRIVCDEVDPLCDALGPGNRLVWAPGLIAGTTASSTSRISVGCKSPLTGGIKESNGGGETGGLLAQAGYRAVIVEGAAVPGTWWVLVVSADGAHLEPAPPAVAGSGSGQSASAAAAALFARYGSGPGRGCALALCGPAGQMRMGIAGIGNSDREGRPSRLNARGAVGAVMGAKGLAALVVLGDQKRPVAATDGNGWKDAVKGYHQALVGHPFTGQTFPLYGTASTLELVDRLGGLCVRNFSRGRFEHADAISGEHMRELILARGGEGMATHACMTGCAMRCSNVYADAAGREVASSLEFETNGLLGANLEIADFDAIARLTALCNDLGADTIETGAALGVAMEAGLLPWGDAAGAERILDQDVRHGTPIGRIIGAGAATAGRVLGVRRVPAVKGQAISAYDPRAIKGNGVTYCTSPMGADHTAGNTVFAKTDHLDPSDKVHISRTIQIQVALIDTLGVCSFARLLLDSTPDVFRHLFRARTGADWDWEQLYAYALDVLHREVDFNRRAGLGPATDRLPEWMRTEPLPPHQSQFDLAGAELDAMWDLGEGFSRFRSES